MKYTIQQYVEALYDSIGSSHPDQHDTVIDNFISLLRKHGALHRYEEIVKAYEKYDKDQKGQKEVTVTTTEEAAPDKDLMDVLNSVAGKQAEVVHKKDDTIVGGVVIRVDDTLIDASAKKQLDTLEHSLKNSSSNEQSNA